MNLEEIFKFLPVNLRSIIILRSKIENNCIIWTGAITKSTKYGKIKYKKKCYDVHRLIAIFLYGELTRKDEICHIRECPSRTCINPSHFYKGDKSSNMRDAYMNGTLNFIDNSKRKKINFKTHCKSGHEYTPENTYYSNTSKHCKTCRKR